MFKAKKDPAGLKFKVRLVAQGFSMIQSVDHDSTYAPTIDLCVILVVRRIAATLDWSISGVDVGNACLEAMSDGVNLVMHLQPRD